MSYESGLPLTRALVLEILNSTPLTKKEKEIFLLSKYPFEGLIQIFKLEASINYLLNIFSSGVPNNAHRLIAKLGKKKIIKLIVTTNFDTLIEQALKKENVPFKKYYTDKQIEKFRITKEKLLLIKLHGSIEDKTNLGITLEKIATKANVLAVRHCIQKLLFHKDFKTIFFSGYSASDYFDIIPQLKSFSGIEKEIVFISHTDDKRLIDLKSISTIETFRKYKSGKSLTCNTNNLVRFLSQNCFKEKYVHFKRPSLNWEKQIHNWAHKNGLNNNGISGLIVSGRLMAIIGHYKRAEKYYLRAIDMAIDQNNIQKLAHARTYLGQAYRNSGLYDDAIDIFTLALKDFKTAKDSFSYAKTLADIGSTYRLTEKYTIALSYHKRALKIFAKKKTRKKFREIQDSLISIGNIYLNKGKFLIALRYYKKAERYLQKSNNKSTEAILLNSIAAVYIKLGKLTHVLDYLEKSFEIATKLGIPRILSAIENNRGDYFNKIGDTTSSLKSFNNAFKFASGSNDVYQTLRILINRIEILEKLKNYNRALKDIDFYLSIDTNKKGKAYLQLSKEKKRLQSLIS